MDFAEQIQKLARSVKRRRNQVRTEEATKTSLIMPFIAALGYDIHEPGEVVPEFTADAGVKQSEKVDYAIMKDGRPSILVECKSAGVSLGKEHLSQLIRYYAVTDARFAILTNGVEYRFYTDLRKPNVMDESPFLVVNLLELEDWQVDEICHFAKPMFNEQGIWERVHLREIEQKELQTITDNIVREFESPSRDLVRLLAKGVLGKGAQRKAEWERVTSFTKRALDKYMGTIDPPPPVPVPVPPCPSVVPDFSKFKQWGQTVENTELLKLFLALHDYYFALGGDVLAEASQTVIAFKRQGWNVVAVKPRPRETYLVVRIRFLSDVSLGDDFVRDVRNVGGASPKGLEIIIRNHADLERAKLLIKRSYDETG